MRSRLGRGGKAAGAAGKDSHEAAAQVLVGDRKASHDYTECFGLQETRPCMGASRGDSAAATGIAPSDFAEVD